MRAAKYNPDEFEKLVAEQGGRADFVFEDDRPFAECHASTLVETCAGDLLCAWFGGTKEGHTDVGIWLSRFSGGAWSAPTRAAKVEDSPHWNPVLFRDPACGLYLFFKVGPSVPAWRTYWMRSDGQGGHWSDPVELVPGDVGGRGPVKNKPIILASGAWLAPASTEIDGWDCFADRSEDGGASWQRTENFQRDPSRLEGKGVIQPTFWESEPGQIHALMRSTCGSIIRSDSEDDGRTWRPLYLTDLPNNNSGFDAVRLDDGRVLLIYNPVSENWGPRTPINLAISEDNGQTWTDIASLETAPGEYSYPGMIRSSAGISLCYTWKRERVRLWQIPLAALG